MKLRLLAVVVGLVLSAGAAHAQIGIYGTPVFSRISNPADTGVFAFLGAGTSSRVFAGFGIGGYDNFYHSPGFDAGVDVRGNILRGNGAQLNSFLVGARASFKPVRFKFRPYVQAHVGVGGSKAAHNPLYYSKLEYDVDAGLDYPLAKHFDWRVIEVGYGAVPTINSNSVDRVDTSTTSSTLINFSTGFVIRFH